MTASRRRAGLVTPLVGLPAFFLFLLVLPVLGFFSIPLVLSTVWCLVVIRVLFGPAVGPLLDLNADAARAAFTIQCLGGILAAIAAIVLEIPIRNGDPTSLSGMTLAAIATGLPYLIRYGFYMKVLGRLRAADAPPAWVLALGVQVLVELPMAWVIPWVIGIPEGSRFFFN